MGSFCPPKTLRSKTAVSSILHIIHKIHLVSVVLWGKRKTKHPLLKKMHSGNFLAVQWLRLGAFTPGAQVQSLVRELRSRKLCGAAKKKKCIPVLPLIG